MKRINWTKVEESVDRFEKKMKIMPEIAKLISSDLEKNQMIEPKTGVIKDLTVIPDSTLRRYVILLDKYIDYAPDYKVRDILIDKKVDVEREQVSREMKL